MKHLIQLTKPRVTAMTLLMAAVGLWRAGARDWTLFAWTLLGVFLSVGCANGLNMSIERRTDGMMTRTANRPLPTGALTVNQAVAFSLFCGLLSMVVLVLKANVLTALLGLSAIVVYAGVYTPLKLRSTLALPIGALPGAMPPLMGYTAVTNEFTAEGLALFGILALWQIPHFLAISVANLEDYTRAGIQTVPGKRGERMTRLHTIAYTTALIPTSLIMVHLGVAGWVYGGIALVSGVGLLYLAAKPPGETGLKAWAIDYFKGTLVYLPAITLALVLDVGG